MNGGCAHEVVMILFLDEVLGYILDKARAKVAILVVTSHQMGTEKFGYYPALKKCYLCQSVFQFSNY